MHDWEEIRKQHGPQVWAAIGKILKNLEDVTDCYQDVFLEAFSRSQTSTIRNMPGFLRWLAVHRALDLLRKLKSQPRIAANRSVDEVTCKSTCDQMNVDELLESIRCELSSLSAEQAESFWLCCVEGLKYREAAEVMGLEPQYIGMLVHRARKHLSQALVDWDHARTV